MGPQEQVTLAHVARRHYVDRVSQIDLADELGISRFRVARLLDKAHRAGIVRFDISVPSAIDAALSEGLRAKYGLSRAIVVRCASGDDLSPILGRAGAELLAEILSPGDVLGLTAGRTLAELSRQVTRLPACDVVQLCGVAGPVHSTAVEVIRRISRAAGREPATLYAPLVASDAEAAAAIRRQADVAATLRRTTDVTVAVVAVGSWAPPDSQMHENAAVSTRLREQLAQRDVVADIGPVLLDRHGHVVDDIRPLSIGIDAAVLRAIPDVIAVAGGARKRRAIHAALMSGIVKSIVTDAQTARALLGESDHNR